GWSPSRWPATVRSTWCMIAWCRTLVSQRGGRPSVLPLTSSSQGSSRGFCGPARSKHELNSRVESSNGLADWGGHAAIILLSENDQQREVLHHHRGESRVELKLPVRSLGEAVQPERVLLQSEGWCE